MFFQPTLQMLFNKFALPNSVHRWTGQVHNTDAKVADISGLYFENIAKIINPSARIRRCDDAYPVSLV